MTDRSRQRIATWTLAAGLLVSAGQVLYAADAAPSEPRTQPTSRPAAADPFAGRRVGSGLPSGATENDPGGPPGGSFGYGLAETLLALAIVAGLIFLVRYLLRRLGAVPGVPARSDAMEIVARAPISARQQLLLVHLGRRLVLLGSSSETMAPLAEISDPSEVADLLRAVGRSPAEALTGLQERSGQGAPAGGQEASP